METLGDREQGQRRVALAFGARRPTSRLQSKCSKLGARGGAKCSPRLLLHLGGTGFNILKLLEDLYKSGECIKASDFLASLKNNGVN